MVAISSGGRALARALGVRPGEGQRVLRLFAFAFLLTAAAVLAKSAQREIFLSAYPRSRIPDAYLLSALTLMVSSIGLFALAARLGLTRLLRGLLAAGVLLWAVGWAAVHWRVPGAPLGLYVLVEVFCSLLIVQAWAVIAEALDVRSAKRLLPVVGLGAGLAWTLGGLGVGALARGLGPSVLLAAAPFLLFFARLALGAVARRDLNRPNEPRAKEGAAASSFAAGLRYIAQEPLMRVLAAVAVVEVLIERAIDFQLLATAQDRLGGEPGAVTSFMGLFYGLTGALTLAAPFAFSGKVLSRFGSTRALMGAQLWAMFASVLFFLAPVLAAMVLLAGGERVLKQALSAPARSQILGVLSPVRRAQAAAALSGILGALSAVAASLALRAYPETWPLRWISLTVAALLLCLVLITWLFLRKSYIVALRRSVDGRKMDLEEQDGLLMELDQERVLTLAQELSSGEPARGEFAVSLAGRAAPVQARPLLRQALEHPSPQVVAQAAEALGRLGEAQDRQRLLRALGRADLEEVACACMAALAKLGVLGPQERQALVRFADDSRPRIRALARALLVRLDEAAGKGGGLHLVGLLAMLASPKPAERVAAAQAMGEVPLPRPELQRALVPLMSDVSLEVRRAALRAAVRLSDGPLVRAVLFCLEEPELSAPAFEVLTQLDEEALGQVEELLPFAPGAIVGRTASALARAEPAGASRVLERLLEHADGQVRYGASRALVARRRARRWSAQTPEDLLRRIQEELEQGYRYHAALIGLSAVAAEVGRDAERSFVVAEVESRIAETERRLLSLIALLTDPRLARLGGHLRGESPQLAARVLELVEQSVDPELAAQVVPFFEARPATARAKDAVELYRVPQRFLDDPLGALLELGDPHLPRCALLAFREVLSHRFPELLTQEGPMLHLVERIRFLRNVPLFKGLSPEDLMKLAEIAEPAEYEAAQVIFRKGDVGDVLCVVVRGRVEIRNQGQLIATQGPNDFFGELALFDHEPRSADAVCVEQTGLLEIQGVDLDGLMERRPEIAREIIRVLAKRLRRTTDAMVGRTLSQSEMPAVKVA